MKIKISDITDNMRCPWCGEVVSAPFERIHTTKVCPHCYRRYAFFWSNLTFLLEILWYCEFYVIFYIWFNVVINSYSFLFWFIIFGILIFISCPHHYLAKPYKRVKNEFDCKSTQIQYSVTIDINCAMIAEKYISKLFINNMILPICFKEHTEYICVTLTDVVVKKGICKCTISDLPLGNHFDKEIHNKEFYIFFNREIIGEGKIVDSVK